MYLGVIFIFRKYFKYRKKRINYYTVVDILLYVYSCIKKKVFKEIKFKSEFIRYILVGFAFFAIFYKMYTVPSYDNYFSLVIFISIMIIIITKLISSGNYFKLNWKNPLALSWIVLSCLMIISELITSQKRGFVGCFNLIILGSLFFAWGTSEQKDKLLGCIKAVILITFIPCIVKCLFFYTSMQGIDRYAGIYNNSNQFAAYAIVVFAVVVADIDYYFTQKQFKFEIIADIILLGFSSCFLWLTQTRTTLIAMMCIVFLGVAKNFIIRKEIHNIKKNLLIIVLVFSIVPLMWMISLWAINNISLKDCADKILVENTHMPFDMTMTVNAADNTNRIMSTLKSSTLSGFSNGRFEFWIAHFRNMNLFGHKDYLYIPSLGDITPSHNSIIGIMYKYGIFAGIPYIIMLAYSFWYSLKYFLRYSSKKLNSMLPLNITIAFVMCAMLDTMDERPFGKMLWLIYYLVIGFLISANSEEVVDDYGEYSSISCNIKHNFNYDKIRKIIISIVTILFIFNTAKFIFLGISENNSPINQSSIFNENVVDTSLQKMTLGLISTSDTMPFSKKEEVMPDNTEGYNPIYVINGEKNYLYYQKANSKEICLKVSKDSTKWDQFKGSIIRTGKAGEFDDTTISSPNIVYNAPYYYMFYLGTNSKNETSIGLAVSNDGINWTKKNIRGAFPYTNISDIKVELDSILDVLTLKYVNTLSENYEAKINIFQNRDKTQFDSEADWSTSLVSSENVLFGSYRIEGVAGSKSVWMQTEGTIDLYKRDTTSKLKVRGNMPLDIYAKKDVKKVTMKIKINGKDAVIKTFTTSGVFEVEVPLDNTLETGELIHVEITTDHDFNPSKIGLGVDQRDLSYVLYSIKQE
jgi:hypothetical protein